MDEDLTITTKDTYSSLKAPFHSLSLPQGFLQRTMGNLPLLPGVSISTYNNRNSMYDQWTKLTLLIGIVDSLSRIQWNHRQNSSQP